MDKTSSCVPMEEGVGDMEDTSALAVGVDMREKPSLGLLPGGVNPAAYAESEVILPVSSNSLLDGGVAVPRAHQQPTTGIKKVHGVNQKHRAISSQAPLWLERLVDLHDEFHVKDKICKFHENRKNGSANLKLSLIYYCVTCKEGPLCKFCVDEKHGCGADGTRHSVVRTKTISGNICVSVDDITKASRDGMDYADVKHYCSNGIHVLFLKPKGNSNGSRAAKCIGCKKPAARHKGGFSRVSLKGGDDPAAEDPEGNNGYCFCSIWCKIEYVNNPMHSKENRPSMILRSQKAEEEELGVKPMMNKVQCVEEKKQQDGKQKKRKTKCEDDVVNGEDNHAMSVACKRLKREVTRTEVSKTEVGKVKKKTKIFSVEDPLRVEIKEMCGPRKVFFAQAPEACAAMSMEDVFGMFKGAGWEVKHFEAGVAEAAAAKKKCKKNLKKVLQVFNMNDEKKTFFVNVPTSSLMSDFIFGLLPDFHVAVTELHSHEDSRGSEGSGGSGSGGSMLGDSGSEGSGSEGSFSE